MDADLAELARRALFTVESVAIIASAFGAIGLILALSAAMVGYGFRLVRWAIR